MRQWRLQVSANAFSVKKVKQFITKFVDELSVKIANFTVVSKWLPKKGNTQLIISDWSEESRIKSYQLLVYNNYCFTTYLLLCAVILIFVNDHK